MVTKQEFLFQRHYLKNVPLHSGPSDYNRFFFIQNQPRIFFKLAETSFLMVFCYSPLNIFIETTRSTDNLIRRFYKNKEFAKKIYHQTDMMFFFQLARHQYIRGLVPRNINYKYTL